MEERKWGSAYPSWIVEPQNKRKQQKENKKKGGAQIQSRPFKGKKNLFVPIVNQTAIRLSSSPWPGYQLTLPGAY